MNKRKMMMQSYAATWIVFIGSAFAAAAEIISLDQLHWMSLLGLGLVLATLILMHFAARDTIGRNYAIRHSILGFLLLPLFGIGFIVIPPLVNSEIRRQNKPEVGNGGNVSGEELPS